jgi:hypothetical protein
VKDNEVEGEMMKKTRLDGHDMYAEVKLQKKVHNRITRSGITIVEELYVQA